MSEPRRSAGRPASASKLALTRCVSLLTLVALGAAGCTTASVTDPTVFTTNDVVPRLQNGEPERVGSTIRAAAFNAKAIGNTIAPYSGYVGDLKVDYAGDRSTIETDLNEIGAIAPPSFDPNQMVTIDFRAAKLSFILDQLLNGALGVNYVAPDGLPENIDFRTETPVPKSRIIQIVRDLLARNGLVMRFVNGIFHIGTAETIEALERNSSLGRSGEEVSRIVKLGRSNAQRVTVLAGQLLAEGTGLVIASSSDTLVVRASPGNIDSVEKLVRTLSDSAVSKEQLAVIPLTRSAPEAVAAQLTEFYSASLRESQSSVIVVPLQNQQAILVGAADPAVMTGLQQLARQIDRSVTDISELRIIPLTNIRASDIVPQLTALFGSATSSTLAAPAEPSERRTGVESRIRPPAPPSQPAFDDNEDGTGLAVPAPTAPSVTVTPAVPPAASGGSGEGGGGAGGGSEQPRANVASATPSPQPGETRIVADERNNAILVYSTYTVFKRMQETVQTLDVAQAQVVIEATVIEVQLTDQLSNGVQFFLQSNGVVAGSGIPNGNQSPAAGGVIGVGADIGNVRVDAVLRALRSVTNVKVVSSPYLTVVDGRTARLVIGDQIPFATSSQTSSNTGGVTVTQEVRVLDTGVVLQITPRIHANNSVNLDIVQSVSTPTSQTGAGDLTPVIATRDISSQILAQSGRTILLGGLIQDRLEKTQDGVPKIADVPVVGNLFRQKRSTAQRTELVVLITPRVVRASNELESITRLVQGMGAVAKP